MLRYFLSNSKWPSTASGLAFLVNTDKGISVSELLTWFHRSALHIAYNIQRRLKIEG